MAYTPIFNSKGKSVMISFIEVTIFCILAAMVGYIGFFSIAAKFFKKKNQNRDLISDKKYKFAVLVPAYKEDAIIVSTAQKLLQLNYPTGLFDIYIIADSFREETIDQLQKLPVKIIRVEFEKSTKLRALNTAMQLINEPYDIAVVLDADNILHSDFLIHVHRAFDRGYRAVQGQRLAKNMDTSFSILDAASEMINNSIFRKGHQVTGLSSSIIGSGMAFSYILLKKIAGRIDAVGGFDKILQLEIVKQGYPIAYVEEALIFDEKISHADAFGHQRRRWLSSQAIYLKKFFIPGCKMLIKGKFNYFNLAVMHNIVPPRILLLGNLAILFLLSVTIENYLLIGPLGWSLLFGVYLATLLLALPKAFFSKKFLPALWSLPKVFLLMVKGLFQIKGANKSFIHTDHYHQEITNPMFKTDER